MATNTKHRSQEIQAAAAALLADVDVTQKYPLRELSKQLSEQVDCHYDTAKLHLAKAARRKRYNLMQEHSNWGGVREGAGYPKGQPRKAAAG